jgi:hypothetical protein
MVGGHEITGGMGGDGGRCALGVLSVMTLMCAERAGRVIDASSFAIFIR